MAHWKPSSHGVQASGAASAVPVSGARRPASVAMRISHGPGRSARRRSNRLETLLGRRFRASLRMYVRRRLIASPWRPARVEPGDQRAVRARVVGIVLEQAQARAHAPRRRRSWSGPRAQRRRVGRPRLLAQLASPSPRTRPPRGSRRCRGARATAKRPRSTSPRKRSTSTATRARSSETASASARITSSSRPSTVRSVVRATDRRLPSLPGPRRATATPSAARA